jgi:hypothetical protein
MMRRWCCSRSSSSQLDRISSPKPHMTKSDCEVQLEKERWRGKWRWEKGEGKGEECLGLQENGRGLGGEVVRE